MVKRGSGEALAQLIAERTNPKTDVWFGGTATRTCRLPNSI